MRIVLDTVTGHRAEEANREVHLTPAETDRQKKDNRTNLWRVCESIAYEARTNWQKDREVQMSNQYPSVFLFFVEN